MFNMKDIFETMLEYHAKRCNPTENPNHWKDHCYIIAWLINKEEIWVNNNTNIDFFLDQYGQECNSIGITFHHP